MERGIAGIQGPMYSGSGCFHTRRVMYGLYPDDVEDNGSLSSVATSKYYLQIHKFVISSLLSYISIKYILSKVSFSYFVNQIYHSCIMLLCY